MIVDILLALGKCQMCTPKGKKPQMKWGIVIRMDKKEIFICRDCLKNLILKTYEMERGKSGSERTISPV